ncbi:MAG: GLPGLI family protein [Bacteroidales bacterium]|nr:GLPGLI family protein [Bacteroidales bacterium]
MRNSILITAILFANYSYAQLVGLKYKNIEPANIVVTYSLQYQQDSTNPSNIRSSTFYLFMGNTISKYVNCANYSRDTATRRFTTNNQVIDYMNNPQIPKAGILYQIFKNYPKGKLTFTDHIPSNTFKFEENLDIFHWNLTGDKATNCGYKTQKATCDFGGRSWSAWFSPDLPYSDGPYKFNGLPGLIVKVYDSRNHYVFNLLSINKLEPEVMVDIQDKEYIVTTKQGFFKAFDSFREDITNRARQVSNDGNFVQTVAKNMAQNNNPIELIRK